MKTIDQKLLSLELDQKRQVKLLPQGAQGGQSLMKRQTNNKVKLIDVPEEQTGLDDFKKVLKKATGVKVNNSTNRQHEESKQM